MAEFRHRPRDLVHEGVAGTGGDAVGKLRKLARRWASGRSNRRDDGGRDADELTPFEKDCARFGINPAAFNLGKREERAERIAVWPDMLTPLALFYDAEWRWITLAMGGVLRTGIIRSELEASARLLRTEITPAIFADIRVMEEAALEWWARKR